MAFSSIMLGSLSENIKDILWPIIISEALDALLLDFIHHDFRLDFFPIIDLNLSSSLPHFKLIHLWVLPIHGRKEAKDECKVCILNKVVTIGLIVIIISLF